MKLSLDPLIATYQALNAVLCYNIKMKSICEIDPFYIKDIPDITRSILIGNGCTVPEKIGDESNGAITLKISDTIELYCIEEGIGNEENQFIDVMHVFGTTRIVVFLEYFNDILTEEIPEEDQSMEAIAKRTIGNSNYFTAIQYIVSIVCEILQPFRTSNTSFAMCDLFRKAPYLIAGRIINQIKPIDMGLDVSYLPMDASEFKYYIEASEDVFINRLVGAK